MKNKVVVNIFWLHYWKHPPAESQGMNKTNGHYYLYPPFWPTDNRFSINWFMCGICHLLWQSNVEYLAVIL